MSDFPINRLGYDKDFFHKVYFELRDEHYNDYEIADKLFVTRSTLSRWKKKHNVFYGRKNFKNKYGVTNKQFDYARTKGLSRTTVLKRLERNGGNIYMAINAPLEKQYSNKNAGRKKKNEC